MKPNNVRESAKAALQPLVGRRVLVALSGGADSVTLLHVALSLAGELSLTVGAAHLHHGLRGAEADRDEAFVRDLCDRWQVPLFVRHADVAAIAAQTRRGIEETGRALRYGFFNEIADAEHFDAILTAHTATDNLETVLLHLCRGSGTRGMGGIAPQSGRVFRPLLGCDRHRIEDYCRENGLAFVTDSTNADTAYSRNRLRAEVVPVLESLNPQIGAAITRLTACVRQDDAVLEAMAADLVAGYGGEARALLAADRPVRIRALTLLAESAGADPSYGHLLQIEEMLEKGGRVSLPEGVTAVCRQGKLRFIPTAEMPPDAPQTVVENEPFTFAGQTYRLRRVTGEECEIIVKKQQKVFQNAVDCATIAGALTVRPRKTGDRVHPACRNVGKSLHRLLMEARIPEEERDAIPILEDAAGIALVYGLCCDQRNATSAATTACLVLECLKRGFQDA